MGMLNERFASDRAITIFLLRTRSNHTAACSTDFLRVRFAIIIHLLLTRAITRCFNRREYTSTHRVALSGEPQSKDGPKRDVCLFCATGSCWSGPTSTFAV